LFARSFKYDGVHHFTQKSYLKVHIIYERTAKKLLTRDTAILNGKLKRQISYLQYYSAMVVELQLLAQQARKRTTFV